MLADAIKQAQAIHRGVLEAAYDGICNVYGWKPVKDPVTKVTRHEEVALHVDLPCHLSYSASPMAAYTDTATISTQAIKLCLAPETAIHPGSKVVVTQQGRTEEYSQSGKPAVYSSHQEIRLETFRGWAK